MHIACAPAPYTQATYVPHFVPSEILWGIFQPDPGASFYLGDSLLLEK